MSSAPPSPAHGPLRALAERWAGAKPAERANTPTFVAELCAALGVEPPRPAGSGYEFERAIRVYARDGTATTNFVDLYRAGHFILEAKDEEPGRSGDVLLRKAFGQARTYAAHDPSGTAPPYLLVLNGQRELLVWDRWTGDYGGFAAHRRIDLTRLWERDDDAALLRDVWENPAARDPRGRAQQVTEAIAAKLARLAARLEARGHAQEEVSRFLMRCVFTMFAEDVRLLHDEPFRRLLDEVALPDPAEFAPAAEDLWRAMDEGRRFGARRLLRFNGHFFRDAAAIPLGRDDLAILLEAARADWAKVEPSIFGTLLTRALDPRERHRLGAEYTPPAFIERVVRPAVEEPVRERWTAVQAEVLQLRETGKPRDRERAEQRLREFHAWLRGLRVLDPACGSGNFLYVTMRILKRVELEVLAELEAVTGSPELRLEDVGPAQFHGIEIKAWAREIAELTLWIGYHQFWQEHHHVQPHEPLLRDTGTLECRDAVLADDGVEHDPARDRPDPTPRLVHPVTGELVPDPEARLRYLRPVNPRAAEWPEADFIVGNPPYLGGKRIRAALGDGYTDALQQAYSHLPDATDLVTYWVDKAAAAIASDRTLRAGLITTNSIRQPHNRTVLARAVEHGVSIAWAIADHPWVEESGGAAVRVSLIVLGNAERDRLGVLGTVNETGELVERRVGRINADLTAFADVATAAATHLTSNTGLCSLGFLVNGPGFLLDPTEARELLAADERHPAVIKRFVGGKDIVARSRDMFVIDFGARSVDEARAFPVLYNIVVDRVKPTRDANRDRGIRENWWRFHRIRGELRESIAGISRFIATVETMKHRVFTFLSAADAPDHGVVCIATDDPFALGVLSSSVHITWALAAGGRLGVGNDPRYNKTLCFDPFPFPDPPPALRARIADVAERLDAHRKAAIDRSEKVTMTGMYNVVAKLRANEPLTAKEREVHTVAACGVLRDLHDELDALVAEAYGWSWPEPPALVLERLVLLHDERVAEERAGRVRWLRPDYQVPRRGGGAAAAADARVEADVAPAAVPAVRPAWPADAVGQITALRALAAERAVGVDDAVRHFDGARHRRRGTGNGGRAGAA